MYARPKTVRYGRDPELAEQFRQRHARYGHSGTHTGKYEPAALTQHPHLLKDLQGTASQWDPVHAILLRGWNGPYTLSFIGWLPGHQRPRATAGHTHRADRHLLHATEKVGMIIAETMTAVMITKAIVP